MEELRICIGSNDGVVIAPTHMGDTRRFLIYDVFEDRDAVEIGERENTASDMEHAASDKMKAVLEIVGDVQVLVAGKNSPNFRKIAAQTRFQPVVVLNTRDVPDILTIVREHFDEIRGMVRERLAGARTQEIPEFSRSSA